MRAPFCLFVPVLLLAAVVSVAQNDVILVTGFETLDDLRMTWDAKNPASKLTLNTDAQFVSEGAASLLLESVSLDGGTGNTYLGVSISLPEPISLNNRALVFDAWTTQPENTRALYVRGHDSEGDVALSWQSWSSPVVSDRRMQIELIPGMPSGGLSWESNVAESEKRDEIVRLEFIIGTHNHGAPYGIYLDNVRTVHSEVKRFMDIEEAKPLFPNTPLLAEGEPGAIILSPEGDDWRAVAQELQSALQEKIGVALPLRAADTLTDEDLRETQVIALGCVANNPRLLHLYAHSYTYADDLYPGADGYVVQSIHDPWGTDRNVLLIGASTPDGARLGLPELLAHVGDDGVVPPVFRVKLTGLARDRFQSALDREPDEDDLAAQREAAEKRLDQGAHTGLFGQLSGVGASYAQTRNDSYAQLFAWLVRRAKEHHDSDPGTYGGPWGMDSDFQIRSVIPLWDQVEESPALTDDDRLEVTRILFQWVSDVGVRAAQSVVGNERVRFNHQTFPALGLLFAGEYFTKYYTAAEARRWTDIADAAFQMQAKAFKSHEDCNGYQWLTLYHTMQYALAKPDFTFFDNQNARRCADFAILCMDNLGYQVTYGDTGAFTGWWSEMPFLAGALRHYRDPHYAWALDKKFAVSNRASLGQFHTDLAGEEPEHLLGAIAWPLDPYYYRTFGGPDNVPEEHAVDKVVFRNGFDPQDQYLLLDGLSNGGHKHLDGNSISRWTENGRIWLADADYILSLPKYHNGVLISRDGQSQRIPDFVELEHIVDTPSFGASTTTYRDYAGVDWRRHILWMKGEWFLVADEMIAKQDGDYTFRVVWNTIGEVELTDNGLSIHQNGEYASISIPADCRLTLHDDPAYGKNWSGYEHIEDPVVRVFQAVRSCELKAGEKVVLFSLLHASGEEPSEARLVRINDGWAAIDGLDEPAEVAAGGFGWAHLQGADEESAQPVMKVAGEMCVLTPRKLLAVGATDVEAEGFDRFLGLADIEYDLDAGTARMIEPPRTGPNMDVAVRDIPGPTIEAGTLQPTIEHAIATAPAVQRPTKTAIEIPRELNIVWTHREKLDSYLLTGNAGAFEAVDVGAKLSASPEPLAANVFAQPGKNTVDNILDGGLLSTDGGCMWADDQTVTLNIDLDQVHDISKIVLRSWFATSSSRDKLFQLGSLVAEASNDGFEDDTREIIDFADTEIHGNWGEPGYGPKPYEFAGLDAKARSIRLTLTPRPGTAIYIAELEVWGDRPGLAIDYETLMARSAPVHRFQAIESADLDGDGREEIIAGSTNGKVYAFAPGGEKLWELDTGGRVNAVTCVDFQGDGRPTVIAGSMGATVTAISGHGENLWTFQVPYYKRTAHVRVAFPADLSGDGRQSAIVGTDNWHFYALDAEGKELWSYESVHGSTCGVAGDVDGDGKDEVIAGTEYYWWHVVQPDGKKLFSYSTRGGPHANAAAVANLDGDATQSVLFAGADGNVHVIGPDGKLRRLFNTGDEVTAVAAADIDGDGIDEILATSLSGNVYAISAEGDMIWRRDLGCGVVDLAVLGEDGQVVAGCADGALYAFAADDGAVIAGARLGAPILCAIGVGSTLAVATEDGELRLLALE